VDDAAVVRRFERIGHLPRDRQRFVDGNRTAGDSRRQIFALDQLHHQRRRAAGFLDAVDLRDARVIERGQDFGFALKPRHSLGVLCH
jgi:hypothetical protein